MTRFRLTLEYDGAAFVGWQRQDSGPGVQAAVEAAVTAFCGERRTVTGAGRTDAGVHALAQVAHVDIARATTADTVRDALNAHLRGQPVAVVAAEAVGDDFHARFSAVERHYLYRILVRPAPPALERGRVWWLTGPLDAAAMHDAARALTGRHDFTSFRAGRCQAGSPLRTLESLDVAQAGEEIRVTARARSFLHHQVRNMVGTLKLVGAGRWTRADVARALAARDRAASGPTAPAHGLCLLSVRYP